MKAWVTKYALTLGIEEVYGEVVMASSGMLVVKGEYMQCYHGNDWHESKEEALARAEVMRKNKIKSLEKQLAKLRTLKF